MSKLKTLCEMYERTETEIAIRQIMLANLETEIMAIVSQLSPKIMHEYDVTLPQTLQNARQRINKETEGKVMCHMRGLAEQAQPFTRPELCALVSEVYTSVSINILNRLFDAQNFQRVGTRPSERGNPILYAA